MTTNTLKQQILEFVKANDEVFPAEIALHFNCGGNYAMESRPNIIIWTYNHEAASAIGELIADGEIIFEVCPPIQALMFSPMRMDAPIVNGKNVNRALKGKKPYWLTGVYMTAERCRQKGIKPTIGRI